MINSRDLLIVTIALQAALSATIFLGIPIARQVIGFLYLSFIPGAIVVKLTKLDRLGVLQMLIFSLGLSIIMVMLLGLALNEVGPLFGLAKPLSLVPLFVVLSCFTIGGAALCFLLDSNNQETRIDSKIGYYVLVLAALPILSLIGTYWVNTSGNSIILLALLILISVCVTVIGFLKRSNTAVYSVALFMIALSILFHSSMVSSYIVPFGSDVPVEYSISRLTSENSLWSARNPYYPDNLYGRINSMLSVAILPAIYSTILAMDLTSIFKIVFPLIFAFVPLGLYQVLSRYVERKYAFLSAFLLVSQQTFYTEMLGLNRQMIGELFLVLILGVIVSNKINNSQKVFCFALFAFGMVVSHYALSEIFFLFILVTFLALTLFRKKGGLTAVMVALLCVMMFAWYIYTSDSAVFSSVVDFGNYVYNQLGDFLNPASRGQTVLAGLGLESPPTIWNAISRVFAYITQFLIVVGFLGLVAKKTKVRFEEDFRLFVLMAAVFLAVLIIVPGLANTMNMTRFYHVLLFFLSPLCVIGGQIIGGLIRHSKKNVISPILLLAVIVPYFLFQTGFVYETTGTDSYSIPLSMYRMTPLRLYGQLGYLKESNVYGASWFSIESGTMNYTLYADTITKFNVLSIYGMVYRGVVNDLFNTTIPSTNSRVYLGTLNTVHNIFFSGRVWQETDLSFSFGDLSKVYSNGGSELYVSPSSQIGIATTP